jgi:hypothetical protein
MTCGWLARTGALFGGAVCLAALAIGSARAVPLTVTFNPDSIPGVTGLSPFQADNYKLTDFTVATITNATGNFTQSGTLQIANFLLNTTTLTSSQTGLMNGTGSSSYGLYMTFTASGYVGVNGGAFVPGSSVNQGFFRNISYSLVADPGNSDTVSATGVLTDNGTADVVLATGGLAAGGVNQVSVDVATPSADVLLSIVKSSLGNLFFQSPADLTFQEDSFTNTTTVATVGTNGITTTVAIDGGGGNGTFEPPAPLPEPTSLMVFGVGLTLLGLRGRRRRS